MKLNPKSSLSARKRVDFQLKNWQPLFSALPPPRKGWLKSIREALGMSSRQLAANLGNTSAHILASEHREEKGTITLETLQKIAQAMDCRLIYALVPNTQTLEQMVDNQAKRAAERIIKSTTHSMRLEAQTVSNEQTLAQIEELAFELKQKLDPRIWSQK